MVNDGVTVGVVVVGDVVECGVDVGFKGEDGEVGECGGVGRVVGFHFLSFWLVVLSCLVGVRERPGRVGWLVLGLVVESSALWAKTTNVG